MDDVPRRDRSELEDLLQSVALTRSYGFHLCETGDGECAIKVVFQPVFERLGGIVSGQVFMAAADVAMWLAIKGRRLIYGMAECVDGRGQFLTRHAITYVRPEP